MKKTLLLFFLVLASAVMLFSCSHECTAGGKAISFVGIGSSILYEPEKVGKVGTSAYPTSVTITYN